MNQRLNLTLLTLASCLSLSAMAADAPRQAPFGGACKGDVESLCKDVQPGGGRIAACLREHKDQVSDGCKEAIKARHAQRKGRRAGGGSGSGQGQGDGADQ